jgi:hypothetical protein
MNYNFSDTIINSLTIFTNNLETKLNLENELYIRYVIQDKKKDGYSDFLKNYCRNKKTVDNKKVMNVWSKMSDEDKNKFIKKDIQEKCTELKNNKQCNKNIFQDGLCKSHYKKLLKKKNIDKCKKSNSFYSDKKTNNLLVEYEYENNKYFKDVFNNIYSIKDKTNLKLIGYIENDNIILY